MREIRIWQAIQEIAIYIVFIVILFYMTFTNIGDSAYDYQNSMKKMFDLKEVKEFPLILLYANLNSKSKLFFPFKGKVCKRSLEMVN